MAYMDKVKVLGISGSPRPKGNSNYLLNFAMEGAAEAGNFVESETYNMGGKDKYYAPCDSCFACAKTGDCHHKDSFQDLRDKWIAADAIIYSIPVYHMNYPAQLRAFIDRLGNSMFGYYHSEISKSLKVIGTIAQGTHIFSGQEHAITDLVNHALVMGCIPVTGDLWESYIGVGGWTENNTAKNAIEKLYEDGNTDAKVTVKAARALGKRAAQIALIVKSGALASRELLKPDGGFNALYQRIEQQ